MIQTTLRNELNGNYPHLKMYMALDLFSNKIGVEPRHLYIYQAPRA